MCFALPILHVLLTLKLTRAGQNAMPDFVPETLQMLHEQIRNYKKELYETHASNTVHEKHIVRLQSEIKRLHEAFQVCNVSHMHHSCSS